MRAAKTCIVGTLLAICTSVFAQSVELRGQLTCLREKDGKFVANHEHTYGLKTAEGKTYQLVRGRLSEALFVDSRLRDRELLLRGKVDGEKFEPTAIHSVKNGAVYEVYYWCEICAIESVAPEICVCCQGPVELVERPVKK